MNLESFKRYTASAWAAIAVGQFMTSYAMASSHEENSLNLTADEVVLNPAIQVNGHTAKLNLEVGGSQPQDDIFKIKSDANISSKLFRINSLEESVYFVSNKQNDESYNLVVNYNFKKNKNGSWSETENLGYTDKIVKKIAEVGQKTILNCNVILDFPGSLLPSDPNCSSRKVTKKSKSIANSRFSSSVNNARLIYSYANSGEEILASEKNIYPQISSNLN
ncbi:MAG TPA: hypothetical protein VLF63_02250 [Patescibacteria group bacterium]|nr:hypothetical protein [Patescibacteria group bacterium]